MKIGVLGWDYGEMDPDAPALVETGKERGHEMSLFTLEELAFTPGTTGGLNVTVGDQPAESFDAIISRAKLYGEDWQDRVERLTVLSNVPGLRMFDPADVWVRGYSKFLTAQKLAEAGLPTPPVRSADTAADIERAWEEWGDIIVKPSFGYRGVDVERITDFRTQTDVANDLLARYGRLVCQPFYPTQYGEYRITVAGEVAPINMLKLPAAGSWRCKTLEGASFESFDAPPELMELALRASRVMGITLAGLDVLPTADGYMILEVNPIPGFLNIFGAERHKQTLNGVFDWVEKQVSQS
ncbi:RimK family alpha-L-glutamate ligase [Nonomuraea sp. NPDC050536]|uniref:RimK family alpha-L-glutamate ligase n=1 Tax=Nonomuraea sp. NPDC050536 TaxID=3364366 RepID=UPI0037CC5781